MEDTEKRLDTLDYFSKFSHSSQFDLCESGFYFKQEDNKLECFCCKLNLSPEDLTSDPVTQHVELSPQCTQAAQAVKGRGNYPLTWQWGRYNNWNYNMVILARKTNTSEEVEQAVSSASQKYGGLERITAYHLNEFLPHKIDIQLAHVIQTLQYDIRTAELLRRYTEMDKSEMDIMKAEGMRIQQERIRYPDPLPDDYMNELADDIGEEWKDIGLKLGFSRGRLDQFYMDNYNDSKTAIVYMLIEWRDKHGNTLANKNKLQSILESKQYDQQSGYNKFQQLVKSTAQCVDKSSPLWEKAVSMFSKVISGKTEVTTNGDDLEKIQKLFGVMGKSRIPTYPEETAEYSHTRFGRIVGNSVTDEECYNLAEHIGFEWRRIGLGLGLTKARLEQLRQDYSDTRTTIARMFIEWRNKLAGTCVSLTDKLKGVLQKYGHFLVS